MLNDTDAVAIARRIADETLADVPEATAFLVISSIDRQLARSKRKHLKYSRRQLSGRQSALPDVREICAGWRSGGRDVARSIALASVSAPQSVWWCETREEYELALARIYERLNRSQCAYDAYDHGSCDALVWVTLWRD